MKVSVQLVMENDTGLESVEEILAIEKDTPVSPDGWENVSELRQISSILHTKISQQKGVKFSCRKNCAFCRIRRILKNQRMQSSRTFFGIIKIPIFKPFYTASNAAKKEKGSTLPG